MNKRWFLVFMLLVSVLPGCAQTELASHVIKTSPVIGGGQSQGQFKVGKPYTVMGQRYVPQETYEHSETGIASWYGPGFHGRKTASGERFDMYELTAAHRTLQMPSLVRVTNLDNGRSLVVRVNDRGPFKRGRVIDVSKRAAELLGFKGAGTAKVRLDLLPEESLRIAEAARRGEDTRGVEVAVNERPAYPASQTATRPVPVPGHYTGGTFYPDPIVEQLDAIRTNMYVQAASFGNVDNAQHLTKQLASFGPARVKPALINQRQFYRVQIGPVSSVEAADALLQRVANAGYKDAILVVE